MTSDGQRRYRMGARAEAAARTRQRIVSAAAAKIRASSMPVSLVHVAAGAGVARTTLYRHFSCVSDLLEAVASELLARSDFSALVDAVELPDPGEALRQVVLAGTRIWATDPDLVRNLIALGQTQPDAIPVIERLDAGRVEVMERLVRRLDEAGRLRPGLQHAQATDLLVAATAFAGWDQLVTIRRRTPARASALIAKLAVNAVIAAE